MNYKSKKVYNKKRIKWHKKYIRHLRRLSINYNMPENLLIGIYLIETSFRPLYFRVGEYVLVLLGSFLNLIFMVPLKNYTIGRCQIGIAAILQYYGKDTYKHTKYIKKITIDDFINIVKAMQYKTNFQICAEMVAGYYQKTLYTASSYNLRLRYVGEEFNGRYSYGLLLEDIVNLLDNGYFDV